MEFFGKELLTGVKYRCSSTIHARVNPRTDLSVCRTPLADTSNAEFVWGHKSNCKGCETQLQSLANQLDCHISEDGEVINRGS